MYAELNLKDTICTAILRTYKGGFQVTAHGRGIISQHSVPLSEVGGGGGGGAQTLSQVWRQNLGQ